MAAPEKYKKRFGTARANAIKKADGDLFRKKKAKLKIKT